MKKAIKKHLVFVAVLVTMLNYANTKSPESISGDIKKTILTLNNVKIGEELLIKDSNQLVLYRESIAKSGDYKKGFDLTALPNGDYYFELTKDLLIEVIPFNVENRVVIFNKSEKDVIYKPFVTKAKDNVVLVSSLSLQSNPLALSIYYDNNGVMELIYNETITNTMNIKKAYALDASKKGTYVFLINTNGRTFTNQINL